MTQKSATGVDYSLFHSALNRHTHLPPVVTQAHLLPAPANTNVISHYWALQLQQLSVHVQIFCARLYASPGSQPVTSTCVILFDEGHLPEMATPLAFVVEPIAAYKASGQPRSAHQERHELQL